MKTRFQVRLEGMKRKYYEVFGDLESELRFLKLLSISLTGILLLSLLGSFLISKKPPLVIRVSDVGKAEVIRDLAFENQPTEPEIIYFSKEFVKRYREFNAYTLARDNAEAWNKMTGAYQKKASRELLDSGLLTKIKDAKLYFEIQFREERIERETDSHARVILLGIRTIRSYTRDDFRESSLFKFEVLLKKRPRTRKVPSGLLVHEFSEILLNKIEEKL